MARRRAGSNALGLERTIKAFGEKLGEDDEALVALARGLATAVDADPANAALWREYRAAVTALVAVGAADDGGDDEEKNWLLTIRTPVRTEVRHPEEP